METITAYFGIVRLNRKRLEQARLTGQQLTITMAGVLVVAPDVTPQLAKQAIARVTVHGFVHATKAVKAVLRQKQMAAK